MFHQTALVLLCDLPQDVIFNVTTVFYHKVFGKLNSLHC